MRDAFLLESSLVFLNHGSFGACPRTVFETYQSWQLRLESNPVALLARQSSALLRDVRSTLAEFLGTCAERLILVTNATTAVNTVARSLPLSSGDTVVATDHEYGACDNAWALFCRERQAHYVKAAVALPFAPETFLETIEKQVTPRTKMIFVSHMTSATALTFPLRALCHWARARGILTLVDGAHVPGHIPLSLDDLGADFYVGNCHKWLMAPKGSAFLYARPEHHEKLQGLVVSWGYSEGGGHAGYAGTSALERHHQWQGTRDLAAFLAIPSAIAFQRAHNGEAARQRSHELAARARAGLAALTGLCQPTSDDGFAQMVAMPIPSREASSLGAWLLETHGIEIPVTTHGDRHYLRISTQMYNTREEIELLVRAMDEFARKHWG